MPMVLGLARAGAAWRTARAGLVSPPDAGVLLDRAGAILAAAMLATWSAAVMLEHGAGREGASERGGPAPAADAARGTAETLVAGYVGYPFTHASNLYFERPGVTRLTVHDVQWEGRPFKSPIYYGLRVARFGAGSQAGGMIDFTHSKAIAIRDQRVRMTGERNGRPPPASATIGETFRHMEFSHGHNMLTLNGLWRLVPTGIVVPYVGAGGGINLPHTEVQFIDDPERTYEYQYTGPIGQALAGIEIRLPAASVFVEYKFTLARYVAPLTGRDSRFSHGPDDFWVQLMDWWRGVSPKYGTVTTTLASHQVIGGVGWRTGGPMPAGH